MQPSSLFIGRVFIYFRSNNKKPDCFLGADRRLRETACSRGGICSEYSPITRSVNSVSQLVRTSRKPSLTVRYKLVEENRVQLRFGQCCVLGFCVSVNVGFTKNFGQLPFGKNRLKDCPGLKENLHSCLCRIASAKQILETSGVAFRRVQRGKYKMKQHMFPKISLSSSHLSPQLWFSHPDNDGKNSTTGASIGSFQ